MNEQPQPITKEEIALQRREENVRSASAMVKSVLYRVLMAHEYAVDVYDHKANPTLDDLIGFKDNSDKWTVPQFDINNKIIEPTGYREPNNIEFDDLHKAYEYEYPTIGVWLTKQSDKALYAIEKKLGRYDVLSGFTSELADIVGRDRLELVYRLTK
jgi:hypothetical protein